MAQSIPQTQTAVVFKEHNGPLVHAKDHPVVQPKDLKPGTCLVKLEYSGVCHTDLHAHQGDWPAAPKLPLVGGHEGAGRIVAIANNTETHHKVGDKVGLKWLADSCLDCEICREGQEACCTKAVTHGYAVDGTFQQYAVSYVNHVTPIPDGLPMEQAAPILCAGVTVWSALKKSNTKVGDYVVIMGAGGGLGHLAVQYAANALCLRVIGVDTGADKEKLVKQCGAETFIDFKKGNVSQAIKAASGGVGPHAALIASGSAAAYNEALEYLRPHGTLVAIGLPASATIQADVFWTVFLAKRIVGSYVGNRQDAIEALDIAARGKVRSQIEVCDLGQLEEVYKRMKEGKIAGRMVLKC